MPVHYVVLLATVAIHRMRSTMSNLSFHANSTEVSLSTLVPELFPIISGFLPLPGRSASLLALAMACRRLRDIIIPRILYRDVCIDGEMQVFAFLVKLREAALAKEQDFQDDLLWSHHIHSLSIDPDSDTIDKDQQQDVLHELLLLIRCGGLRNLESLTIHLNNIGPSMCTEIWPAAQDECPNLKTVRLTGMEGEEKSWLNEPGLLRLLRLRVRSVSCFFGEVFPLNHGIIQRLQSLSLDHCKLKCMCVHT